MHNLSALILTIMQNWLAKAFEPGSAKVEMDDILDKIKLIPQELDSTTTQPTSYQVKYYNKEKSLETMKELLNYGQNIIFLISECDAKGYTPLYIALIGEDLPAIKLLIIYGANLFLKNNNCETLYQLAFKSELVRDLFNNDPSVNEEVRKQTYNYNMRVILRTSEIKSKLGVNLESYISLPKINGCERVRTLKEISVEALAVNAVGNFLIS